MDGGDESVYVGGHMNMLQKYLSIEYDMSFDISVGDEVIRGIDLDIRGDIEDGVIYLTSEALFALYGIEGETWMKTDLADSFEELGRDFGEVMSLAFDALDEISITDYINAALAVAELDDVSYTTKDILAEVNAVIGDSAFDQDGGNYVNKGSYDGMELDFIIAMTDGEVTGYSMSVVVDAEGTKLEVSAAMVGGDMTCEMAFVMDIEGVEMEMTLEMEGTYDDSNEDPITAPPADASVIDIGVLGLI